MLVKHCCLAAVCLCSSSKALLMRQCVWDMGVSRSALCTCYVFVVCESAQRVIREHPLHCTECMAVNK